MTIALLPLMRVSEQTLKDLKVEIGNTFLSKIEILAPVDSLPESTYNKAKEQYDADKVVESLVDKTKDIDAEKILVVMAGDLFVSGMNFVYGAAQKGGRLCLISLYRLDQRFYGKESSYDTFKERAVKEAIHELAHCYGLDHCKSKSCVMAFSNHIGSVDEKAKAFCDSCRGALRKAL
jgi:archaemetzincin